MEFKTISDIENPLFNRREIEGELHAEVSPNREEVRKLISENFSASEDSIKIKTINGKFGSKVFLIVANIYKSKKEMDKIELKKKKDAESEKRIAEQKQADVIEEKTEEIQPEEKSTEEIKEEDNKVESDKQQTSNKPLTESNQSHELAHTQIKDEKKKNE